MRHRHYLRRCDAIMKSTPYRSTSVFDQDNLPTSLRRAHNTKTGVWGVLRILSGSLRYGITETGALETFYAGQHVLILPEQVHWVEPIGNMEMQVDFYDHAPILFTPPPTPSQPFVARELHRQALAPASHRRGR